jgi:hypothetical protein
VAQERIWGRVASTELFENLGGRSTTTHSQDGVSETDASLLHFGLLNLKTGYEVLVNKHDCKVQEMYTVQDLVIEAGFLKGSKTVGAQHFRPLVAIVPCRVAGLGTVLCCMGLGTE